MTYAGTRPIYFLQETPLDLAPRRMIAPRRRLREFSLDNTIYRAPNLIVNNDIAEDLSRLVAAHTSSSDAEQPESPPVKIIFIIKWIMYI